MSLQAAAYGLPVVATKNGGPVDILKVLNFSLCRSMCQYKKACVAENYAKLRVISPKLSNLILPKSLQKNLI